MPPKAAKPAEAPAAPLEPVKVEDPVEEAGLWKPDVPSRGLFRNDYLAFCKQLNAQIHSQLLPSLSANTEDSGGSAIPVPSWQQAHEDEEDEDEGEGKEGDDDRYGHDEDDEAVHGARGEQGYRGGSMRSSATGVGGISPRHAFDFTVREDIRAISVPILPSSFTAMTAALRFSTHTTKVSLRNVGLTAAQIHELVRTLPFTQITELAIDDNPLDDPFILQPPPPPRANNPAASTEAAAPAKGAPGKGGPPEAAPAEAAAPVPAEPKFWHAWSLLLRRGLPLTKISLRGNALKDRDAAEMAESLALNESCVELSLSDNDLGDSGVAALGRGLRENRTLKALSLANNGLTPACVGPLMAAIGPYSITVAEATDRLQAEARLAQESLNPPGIIKAPSNNAAAAAAPAPAAQKGGGGKAPALNNASTTPAAKGGKGGAPADASAPSSSAAPDTADLPHFPPLRTLPIPPALLEAAQQAQAAAAQAAANAAAAAGGKKPAAGGKAPAAEVTPAAATAPSLPPLPPVHAACGFTQAELEQAALAAQAATQTTNAAASASAAGGEHGVGISGGSSASASSASSASASFPAFAGLGNTSLAVLDVSRNLALGSKGILKLANRVLTAVSGGGGGGEGDAMMMANSGVMEEGQEEEGGGGGLLLQLPEDFQAETPHSPQLQAIVASRCERLPCTGRLGEFASVHASALAQKSLRPQGEAMVAAAAEQSHQQRQQQQLHRRRQPSFERKEGEGGLEREGENAAEQGQGGEDGGIEEGDGDDDDDEEQRELKAVRAAKLRELERAAVARDLPVVVDQLARLSGISVILG